MNDPVIGSGPSEQRGRIARAALHQAANGYESVQIRSIAKSAGVSPSAVYQHFCSKDDLLVDCLTTWLSNFQASAPSAPISPSHPYRRLIIVVASLTERMSLTPRFADAVARAYLHAAGSAARRATAVREGLVEILADALNHHGPAGHEHVRQVAALVADVWITNLLAIAQNRTTPDELRRHLERAISAIAKNDA
ncbi:TetR/AcrR family transcriptional regulator [Mycobacterium sp. UM_Kg1]|uniref:TetR/AcrR family transcriptional regulator n=1 Tax=Mycobacterium sp. UM_Kg1 TaxID=1545691 RepID=UPI000697BC0E|nr:TetR/AcrR family transcriptional regulator [Mycobacterium sp. UM_Kg1]